MLCAAFGSDTLGSPLAPGKSLLLSRRQSPGPVAPGLSRVFEQVQPLAVFMQFLLESHSIDPRAETITALMTWFCIAR
jgi:hypothetical protein